MPRNRVLSSAVALFAHAALAGQPVTAQDKPAPPAHFPTVFWATDVSGNQECFAIEKQQAELAAFFEKRSGAKCTEEDKIDHFEILCGKAPSIAFPSKEGCLAWRIAVGGANTAPLSSSQKQKWVAFGSCFKSSRESVGVDRAIAYCECTSQVFGAWPEAKMAKKSTVEIQELIKPVRVRCEAGSASAGSLAVTDPNRKWVEFSSPDGLFTASMPGLWIPNER